MFVFFLSVCFCFDQKEKLISLKLELKTARVQSGVFTASNVCLVSSLDLDVLVFLFLKSPKNYIHNKIIVLRWEGSIRVISVLGWVITP